MSDAQEPISLEEVRSRFVESEAHLARAVRSLEELESGIAALSDARASVREAGGELRAAGALWRSSMESFERHLAALREGVDAIKSSDPTKLAVQITALDKSTKATGDVLRSLLEALAKASNENASEQRAVQKENQHQFEEERAASATFRGRVIGLLLGIAGLALAATVGAWWPK